MSHVFLENSQLIVLNTSKRSAYTPSPIGLMTMDYGLVIWGLGIRLRTVELMLWTREQVRRAKNFGQPFYKLSKSCFILHRYFKITKHPIIEYELHEF